MLDVRRKPVRDPRKSQDPRLLLVGHAASPTGYARVLHSLARHLPPGFEIHHLGVNLDRPVVECGWHLHANGHPEDPDAGAALVEVASRIDPRVVLFLDDVRGAARRRSFLESVGDRCKTVLYAAVDDGDVIREEELRDLSELNSVVTFTRYGREAIEGRVRGLGRAFPPCRVIPHGVDTECFFPLIPDVDRRAEGRRLARRRLFPDRRDLDNAFIVLNANRNQPYKRIDLTLEGFARFAEGKPENVKLYLHMGTARTDERPLADRLGIRDRLLVTTEGEEHPDVPSSTLNLIYNACDVGLNTSEVEGWGLVSFEHAATGAAQVVPGHPTCAEIWGDAATFLESTPKPMSHVYWLRGRSVTAEAVAEALEGLYRRPERLRERSSAAYGHATRPELEWRSIAAHWHRHLSELVA